MPELSERDIRKVAQVVREHLGNSTTPPRQQRTATGGFGGFLAMLTSGYSSGYSWKPQAISEDGQTQSDITGVATSAECGKAFHVNGSTGLISGMKVYMFAPRTFFLVDTYVYAATAAASIGAGSSGSVTLAGTATNVTAHNQYAHAVASGDKVTIGMQAGVWIILGADCQEE